MREFKFKYKSLKESKYKEDKKELFRENGNGWWFIDKSKSQNRRKYKNHTQKRNINNDVI